MTASFRTIGIDESGKGDFFGPLVIGAFISQDDQSESLQTLGVKDGKLLSEKRILEIDSKLRRDFEHSLVVIGPEKYNQLYRQIGNLNKLLAWGHAQAIDNITSRVPADRAVSDKFGKPELVEDALSKKGNTIHLTQIVRGERVLQVAAASIIARAAFLKAMDRLSDQYEINLPRGAAAVVDQVGRQLVARHGLEILQKVSKIHFKNYQRAAKADLFPGK